MTDEDRQAYDDLTQRFPYTESFESEYFSEVQSTIESDIASALRDDSKSDMRMLIAQLEVWDAAHILHTHFDEIQAFIHDTTEEVSFLNLIEIGKKRNMIIFKDAKSLEYLRGYFPEFTYDTETNIAITPQVILRKEILAKIQNTV